MVSESKLVLKTAILSSVFTLILLVLASYLFNHSWNLFAGSKSQVFTAEGTSSLKAVPDEAQVYFTVTITAKTLEDAQNQANTKTNSIVIDLQSAGISQDDIKTSNYNSYPNYDQNSSVKSNAAMPSPIYPSRNTEKIISYTVSENVDITIHDISKVNSVIDLATKDEAENISGPNFTFSESKQKLLNDQLRTEAINNAKQKAQSIAKTAEIRLGKIVNVQENSTPYPTPLLMKSEAQGSSGSSAPTQINPGENTLTETVTLSYEVW